MWLSALRGAGWTVFTGVEPVQALQLHPIWYDFDRQLRQLSAEQAAHTPDAEPESQLPRHRYDEDLFQNCEPGGQSRPKPARGSLHGAVMILCAGNRPSQAGGH